MATYARIDSGYAVELFKTDREIAELFHSSLLWVEVGPAVKVGMSAAETGGEWVFSDPLAFKSMPTSVSPAQARLALLGAGLLDQVEAIVAAADVPTQIAWRNASVIERNSPTVAALAAALGLTDAQLDDLFTTAAGIFV